MTWEGLVATLGLPLGGLALGFLSGIFPFVNAEALTVALVTATGAPLMVAAVMAVGQMLAKALMFGMGRGTVLLRSARLEQKREKAIAWMRTKPALSWPVVALSATVGLPPFYVVAVAAGALDLAYHAFAAIGLAGRFARFAALAYGWSALGGWLF